MPRPTVAGYSTSECPGGPVGLPVMSDVGIMGTGSGSSESAPAPDMSAELPQSVAFRHSRDLPVGRDMLAAHVAGRHPSSTAMISCTTSTARAGCSDGAEGLKTHISTALRGLLDRALNNLLERGLGPGNLLQREMLRQPRYDSIDIKEEPVFTDLDQQPTQEIHHIFIKEENVELEIPQDHNEHDPLKVKNEELKYETELSISGSEQESSPVEDSICTEDGGKPPLRDGTNAGTGNPVWCTAEWEESHLNESRTEWPVPGCKKASGLLRNIEQRRHVYNNHSSLTCSVCHKTFMSIYHLKKHTCWHVGQCLYSCDVCSETFVFNSDLKRHSLLHTRQQPDRCSVCNKTFTQRGNLKRHLLLHTGQRLYRCSVCNKSFTQRGNLKRHSLLHTGKRPYSCIVCNKTFIYSKDLKKHSVLHTGQYPYSCSVCKKTFTDNNILNRHLLQHTGQRPYSCNICNKTFLHNSNLKRHSLQHTGQPPFTCNVCNKTFTLSSSLKRHLLQHTGQRPYSCGVCNRTFTRSGHLKKHSLQHSV